MDTRLLKMFCAVADTGSLVTAGRKLHLTASALSHSLKALETDLGCRLFERVGKRMVLNQAGEQLLAQVRGPLLALESAADGIKRLAKWGQTRLRIGASASACQHILPRVIRELKKAHSPIELLVASHDTPRLIELIRESKLDLGLGVTPPESPEFEFRPVFRDEMMFVFAPSHPWAAGKPLSREEIRMQPFILYQRASMTSRLLEQYFRELEIAPSTIMEVASIGAIKELVRLNLGVSVLAPWTVHHELARGSLKMRPLGSKPLRRQWSVMTLASRRLTLAEETFCRACRNQAAAMRLDRKDVPPL
jgi:LysR family transcriptional regulator, low CO2-responsive transcriptional regulator